MADQAVKMNGQANEVFEQGTYARQRSDQYVRVTVTLATVQLLVAISQRFKSRGVRLGLLVIATVLLCLPVYHLLSRPRLSQPSRHSPGEQLSAQFRLHG
jgi:hypothetical protein